VWKRLSAGDKQEFLRNDARTWDAHRHRMAPITAERLAVVRESGRLCQHTGEVVSAEDTGDAVRVLLSAGTVMTVGAVVNCTGPVGDATADPLLRELLACGLARAGEIGLGLATADDGRILGSTGRRAPLWTLGALRRGSLWESTAMPEIRSQAADVAKAVVAHLSLPSVRRQADGERSFLNAVTARVDEGSATALLAHIREYPLDALAVSVAIPTVAFGGLTSGSETAELVESLAPSYGGDWWYAGQLAFVRQDQERWSEAEQLSSYALSLEPSSGHAVHARAHVFYETGLHVEGLRWLDGWINERGPQANHRAHFSWHAALHELMMGDTDAVRQRYLTQLAPPGVSGSRVLVDSGAMLWRCRMTGAWLSHPDPVFRNVVAPLCSGLAAVVGGDWGTPLLILEAIPSRLQALGGSAAQRDVVEETLVYALSVSGRGEDAASLLDLRLNRRPSPLDVRRRNALAGLERSA
jgi:hypothetical protein